VKQKFYPVTLSSKNAVYIKTFAEYLSLKYTRFWWGNPKERDYSEDQGVEMREILKAFLKK
jgi:hypothetical protein